MIGGNFEYDEENKRFILKKDGENYSMENTSSGLKQLGVIQLLLQNRELTENSFLILDEVEVHLHPEFQVQLAEILVLLAKDLNIIIYINTHSSLFIEAIRTYSEQQDLLDETNFYLTCESKEFNKFDIEYIPTQDLNMIYNTLGKPYELLSEISIENQFK